MRKLLTILTLAFLILSCEKEMAVPIAEDYLGEWVLAGQDYTYLEIAPTSIKEKPYTRRVFYDLAIFDFGITFIEDGPYPDTWAEYLGELNGSVDTLTTRITWCVIRGVDQDVTEYKPKHWIKK